MNSEKAANSSNPEMGSALMFLCEAAMGNLSDPAVVQDSGGLSSKLNPEPNHITSLEDEVAKAKHHIFNSKEGDCPSAQSGINTNLCDMDPLTGQSLVTENDKVSEVSVVMEEPCCGLTERRSQRARKRKSTSEEEKVPCPICGYKMKVAEAETHIQTEIHRLKDVAKRARSKVCSEINSNRPKKRHQTGSIAATVSTAESTSPSTSEEPAEIKLTGHQRYQSYLRIKTSRERRSAKRNKKPGEEDTVCPVCNERIIGLPAELADHVDVCLRTREEEENIDVEGDEEDFTYEEYTWAGQTRIRTSTMLPGGLAASGFQVNFRHPDEDVDLELDVDGDDSAKFGSEQYNESDVIPCSSEEPREDKERKALRGALIGVQSTASPLPPERTRWASVSEVGDRIDDGKHSQANLPEKVAVPGQITREAQSANEIIESLKEKIREQTQQLNQMADVRKCLICMEEYTSPVVSIQCWHVHCEECWLRTMGTKKLCPQCNMITSPADLRKIYL